MFVVWLALPKVSRVWLAERGIGGGEGRYLLLSVPPTYGQSYNILHKRLSTVMRSLALRSPAFRPLVSLRSFLLRYTVSPLASDANCQSVLAGKVLYYYGLPVGL
jgi:hypothetical protein